MTAAERLITDNLDVWSSATSKRASVGRGSSKKITLHGINKLRELILELAVRGLLVAQIVNDSSAKTALKKIQEEKLKLIKEKKFKKQAELPPVDDTETTFTIPDSWAWTRLGNISEIGPRNLLDDDREVGFVPMPLVTTSYKGDHGQDIKKWGEIKKGYTHFADGDIGLAKITPCFENSKASIFKDLKGGYGAGTTELHIARPIPGTIEALFVLLYLKAPMFLQVGKTKMTGSAGQKRVPKDFFSGNPMPFPPIAEQKRIVAKVDELMALCDTLETQQENSIAAHQTLVQILLAALTNAGEKGEFNQAWSRIAEHFDTLFTTENSIDQLKQTILQLAVMGKLVPQDPSDEPASVLLEKVAAEKEQLIKDKKIKKQKAFPSIVEGEKAYDLPYGWNWERIGVFGIVGTGATPSRSNPLYWDSGEINWVSSGETSKYFVSSTKEKITKLAIKESNVSVYPPGTLIVAMYGQGKTRGQITELKEPAGTNQACAAIRLIDSSVSHKDYVKLYFWKAYTELRQQAAGGAQPNLNVGKVANAVIPIPPLAEQSRIVKKVKILLLLCDELKSKICEAQNTVLTLANSIAEKAI